MANDQPAEPLDRGGAQPAWHAISAGRALEILATTRHGLSAAEAERRLAQHGRNRLTPAPPRSAWRRFVVQFHDVLIYALIVSGCITLIIGHFIDAGVIFGVVIINAIVGFIQEGRAERALSAIAGMLAPNATVRRDGRLVTVGAELVVPGDIIVLQPGDHVPADLRLIEVRNLQVQEAALTGESAPIEKTTTHVSSHAPIAERTSMAFSGTLVANGHAVGVVVATGDASEIGRVGRLIAAVESVATPLVRQMAAFGRRLTAVIILFAAAIFLFGIAVWRFSVEEMFLAAVGLAVAAIPEGLPAIMTIALAVGVTRMARRNAIIRRLPAVEALGSVTVICSDKTGTLTRNEMTVTSVVLDGTSIAVSGAGYAPIGDFMVDGAPIEPARRASLMDALRGAALCNDASLTRHGDEWRIEGDPTEAALVVAAVKAGLSLDQEAKSLPRTDVIPFESERRLMATLHHDRHGHGVVFVKGAPERVRDLCARQRSRDGERPLARPWWEEQIHRLASHGQRVLALAMREIPGSRRDLQFGDVEDGLVLVALFGMIDPPRPEAIAAVARCRSAGIRVKMITGDHAGTARAVARQLGLARPERVVTGAEINRLDDNTLRARASDSDVFARTDPEHKLRLVAALQKAGEVVAMTGDGVNDAPALKRADIGVAMGRNGTAAAREAAQMVLADDNFASIAAAVEEGRTVYDNLRKSILFILPTNGAEAMMVVLAVALGLTLPITPVQILWVNMVTEITLSLALAFEPAERDIMRRPPRRPDESLLSRFIVWRIVFVTFVAVAGTFGLYLWEIERGAELDAARTVAVNTIVAFEVFYLFNTRFLIASSVTPVALRATRFVWIAVAAIVVLQALFTHAPPMQALFGTTDIDATTWIRLACVAASVFVIVEIEKWLMRRAQARRA